MKPAAPAPPRWAVRLLERALRRDPAASAILGDLREDFTRMARERGRGAARRWYAREALLMALGRWGRGQGVLGALGEDAHHAFLSIRRNPGFALTTAAIIGAGVGAATAVYSVLKPLAVAPLPFDQPGQLVWITNDATPDDNSLSSVSSRTANLHDLRERASSFQGLTGYNAFFGREPYTLTATTGEPERLVGVDVAHDFLDVLGVDPVLGRSFTREEGEPGGSPAVILSWGLWQRRFAADPDIVGRSVTLNGTPRSVVGVLPRDFDFSSVFAPSARVDVLVPFPVLPAGAGGFQGNTIFIVGRLRPGATIASAQAEVDAVFAALHDADPRRWGLSARILSLRDHVVGPFRPALWLLSAAALVLLIVVCVNVSNLLLARSPRRAREVAVRKALGASRARLARQLVLEAVGVALAGSLLGSLLAWGVTAAVAGSAGIDIPLLDRASVDGATLLLAVGLALVTGLVVSVVPALQVTEGGEARVLRSDSPGSGQGRGARRLREGLVVTEVALACLLLIASGLLVRSFRAVLAVDMGFDASGVVAWPLSPGRVFPSTRARSEYFAALAARVAQVPGVSDVAVSDALPLGRTRSWTVGLAGAKSGSAPQVQAYPHIVDPGYLTTLRIPLVNGRGFTPDDGPDAESVVVVNESAARRLFGDEPAVGQSLRFWSGDSRVVGVVRDVRHLSPEMGAGVEVYFPMAAMPDYGTPQLAVRSSRPLPEVSAAVSRAIHELDPSLPVHDFWTLQSRVDRAVSARRFTLSILGAYGAVALLLAGLGIYGVVAQTVAERRSELGVRMALGASSRAVLGDVLGRSLLLTGFGILAGTGLALTAARLLASQLFQVEIADPVTLAGMVLTVVAVASLAAGVPATRAARTRGSDVLRSD